MTSFPGDGWKGDNSQDAQWEDAYEQHKWKYATEIEALMEKHQLTVIEAMKMRFKGHLNVALSGNMPPEWALYSQDERVIHKKLLREKGGAVADLLRELGQMSGDPDDIVIDSGNDPEFRKKKQ